MFNQGLTTDIKILSFGLLIFYGTPREELGNSYHFWIPLSQWYEHPRVLSILIVIWASPSHITLAIWVRVRVRVTGDTNITRVLGMGMPKTRGCPYHFDIGTLKTRRKLRRVSLRKDFWDCYSGQRKNWTTGDLSKSAFERHTSTGSALLTFLSSSLAHIFS